MEVKWDTCHAKKIKWLILGGRKKNKEMHAKKFKKKLSNLKRKKEKNAAQIN
jgi:hypothetical protein